jgi:broad specificity phosphatase PhoE
MGTLYLVRHGQASFGADDYDQLSDLGARQCRRLGEYFGQRGRRFRRCCAGRCAAPAVAGRAAAGPGRRHAAGAGLPGLNEYDSAAVVRAFHPEPLGPATTPDGYRQHFRILRQGLQAWMDGRTQPEGMPSYAGFVAGIVAALDHVRASTDGDVLLVSSGGPISTAVGQVLGMPAPGTIELNMRLRNSALTEFSFNPKRHVLHSFNHLPHLDSAEYEDWITYT